MKLQIRNATDRDVDWLEPFYERLMRPYVELTHEWDPEKFRQSFNASCTRIIHSGNKPIGMIKIEEREDCLYLGDIQIDSFYQCKGIGTKLIEELKMQAIRSNLPIRLRVLKGNPAIRLYLRLGFTVGQELNNSYEMDWKQNKSPHATARG